MPDSENPQSWTLTSLHDHLHKMLEAERRYNDARFRCSEEAVNKADKALTAKLAGMNEFRESLNDQTKHLITKDEYETRHTDLERRLAGFEKWQGERAEVPARLNALGDRLIAVERWQAERVGIGSQQTSTRQTLFILIGWALTLILGVLGYMHVRG